MTIFINILKSIAIVVAIFLAVGIMLFMVTYSIYSNIAFIFMASVAIVYCCMFMKE